MDTSPPPHTANDHVTAITPRPPVTEVTAEAIGEEPSPMPIIPPERRISWLGWIVAILIFMVNRKFGLCLFVVLLIFKQFPTLNLKQLPRTAGNLFRKLRS